MGAKRPHFRWQRRERILHTVGKGIAVGEELGIGRSDEHVPLRLLLRPPDDCSALILAQKASLEALCKDAVGQFAEGPKILHQVHAQHQAGKVMRAGLGHRAVALAFDTFAIQPKAEHCSGEPIREFNLKLAVASP